jgi:hypothetical protein
MKLPATYESYLTRKNKLEIVVDDRIACTIFIAFYSIDFSLHLSSRIYVRMIIPVISQKELSYWHTSIPSFTI